VTKIKLFRHTLSGHAHRAELFLSLLGLSAELINVDLMNGEHKQEDFLKKNRFGQVPVLVDGDKVVADSNAILIYLATTYDDAGRWYPNDPVSAAQVQQFLSVAAGPVAFGPAAARLINVFGAPLDKPHTHQIANNLLTVMNVHLDDRDWLVGEGATIADIANYAYIAHAPEGEVSLEPYPNVVEWLRRIEGLPGFVPMQATEVGLAA